MTKKTIPGDPDKVTDYVYDDLGRMTSVTDENGTIAYLFDDANRLLSVTLPDDKTLAYEYDLVGNRTRITYSDESYVDYTYDALNRMDQVIDQEENVLADYSYNAVRRTGLQYLNGTSVSYAYNDASWVTALFNTQSEQGDISYFTYTHDEAGNRLTNTASWGTQTYYYDCENQLTKVVRDSDGETLGEYTYDPFGKRIQKITNGITTNYIYDQSSYQVIAEYEDDGEEFELVREYIYGVGIDETLIMVQDEERYFYYQDGLWSVVDLTDYNGNTLTSYDYTVYGDFMVSGTLLDNPYTFTGRRYNPECELFDYRTRIYSAKIGRFLQVDPIRYKEGSNLYNYVNNMPINLVDPFGLSNTPPLDNCSIFIIFAHLPSNWQIYRDQLKELHNLFNTRSGWQKKHRGIFYWLWDDTIERYVGKRIS